MTDELVIEYEVYSPRWGINNTYTFTLKNNSLHIDGGGVRYATCEYVEKRNPKWKSSDNSPIKIFTEDAIYPPSIFLKALERAWLDWRMDVVTDEEIEKEFDELFVWLDTVAKTKPNTDFWRQYF